MKNEYCCNQIDQLSINLDQIKHNEQRTLWVVLLTFITMLIEVSAGYWTGSMALLADGYHMASHAGALGVSYIVYKLTKSEKLKFQLSFGSGKLLPLGGYSSAIGLGFVAIWMAIESIIRLFEPNSIQFNEAILIAILGLFVNVVSALILGFGHHHHDIEKEHSEHIHDHNHRGALLHVIADALTSVLAIIALTLGKLYQATWLDPIMGIVGAIVILRWAYGLCKSTSWELLDGQSEQEMQFVKNEIEKAGHKIIDFHYWKIGPGNYSCQLITESKKIYGSEYFRKFFENRKPLLHLIVEEKLI